MGTLPQQADYVLAEALMEKVMFASRCLRRAFILLSTLGLCLFAASCDGFFVSESSIQSVKITPTTVLLKTGDTPADSYPLHSTKTTVGGASSDNTTTATWKSNDPNVVTVGQGNQGGLVTAVGSGSTTVTAEDGGKTSDAVRVMTYSVPTPATLTVVAPAGFNVGGAAPNSYQFRAFLGPDDTFPDVTQNVEWSSDTANAATVAPNTGQVTVNPLATPTTVKITASANVGAPGATTAPSAVTGTLSFTAD